MHLRGLGDIPYFGQDGQGADPNQGGDYHAGGGPSVVSNSAGNESPYPIEDVTSYGYAPTYSVQSPSFSPNFGSPTYTPNQLGGGFTSNYFANQSPPTESLTVSAAPYSSPYQIQAPTFSTPAPAFTAYAGGVTPNYYIDLYNAWAAAQVPVESLTVSATPEPQQVQAPTFQTPPPSFTPYGYTGGITPNYYFDLYNAWAAAQAPVESVTATGFRTPDPVQVQAPDIPDYIGPVQSDYMLPDFASMSPPAKKTATPSPSSPKGSASPGGGASGGGSSAQPKPQQQQPLNQVFNFPKQATPAATQQLTPAQIAALLKSGQITPAQLSPQQLASALASGQLTPAQLAALLKSSGAQLTPDQLAALSPAQLAALLKSGQLTPQQQQAAQQALASKLAAPLSAGGAGMTPAAAQKAAAASASPFQSSAAVLPAILIAGVLVAYGVTHRHEIAKKVSVSYKRARRAFA